MGSSGRTWGWVVGLGIFLALIFFQEAPAKEKLSVMTWGGNFGDSLKEAFAKPFEKKTGIEVEVEIQAGTQPGLARIVAQKGNPQVDVTTTTEPAALVMRSQGAIYKLPVKSIPHLKNMASDRRFLAEDWVGYYNMPNGIFYRADMVPFEIRNWEDLWDARLKNLITAPVVPFASGRFLVTLALLNGGSERNIDPAFKAAERLKPNIAMFFKTDAESIKYIQAKEAGVCAYGLLPNVYKYLGKDSPYRFVIPQKYIMMVPNLMAITNPKKVELAAKFIDFCLSPEPQHDFANRMGGMPTVTNAKLPQNLTNLKILPIDLKNLYITNEAEVNKNLKQWSERWDREIAKK